MWRYQLAWLVVAAGVVVEDRGYTSTSTVYAALDLGPQRFVVSVALKATPAEGAPNEVVTAIIAESAKPRIVFFFRP